MTLELSREQFRSMILYDWKIGLTDKEIHGRLVQLSNFSIEDAAHSDHSSTAVTEETFNTVPAIIEDDSHWIYEWIEDTLSIISSAVISIILVCLKFYRVLCSMSALSTH